MRAGDGAPVLVEIGGLAPGGDAVGRQIGGEQDGRATFVAGAAPGELVRVRLVREKARVAWGELLGVERPGTHRVTAPCPFFVNQHCGGCQWQHVDRQAQLEAKRDIVRRALGIEPDIVAASPDYGYRDRTRMTVGPRGELGFLASRSHRVVDVTECLLLSPPLAAALPFCRRLAQQLVGGDELELQAGREGVHLNLRTKGQPRFLVLEDPVVGIAVNGKLRCGLGDVDVAEAGAPLRLPAGGFAQVGRVANRRLVSAVLDELGRVTPPPKVIVELHAGSGNFTRLFPPEVEVHASEVERHARARGRINAPAARWWATPPGVHADLVLLDPPREGADAAHLDVAARARSAVIYVSCDPQTLARDAARLRRAGLVPVRATALDLMPQTYHVEVVALFERRSPAGFG